MNYCCITRVQTDIKWKNNFISRELLFHVKRIKDMKEITSREAIQTIQNRYSHHLTGKLANNAKELTVILKDFYKSLESDPLGENLLGGYRA